MTIPDTPWKRATVQRRSRRSEEQGAKAEGGFRVAMSGAGRQKGDIRTKRWRIEDKFTDAQSIRITVEWLDKIVREALHTPPGLLPQLRITLPGHKWRLIREDDYLALMAELDSKKMSERRVSE